jgi:putative Holliday junction resolvase
MAIDYGDTRTGVAFSDLSRMIVGETLVITETNAKKLAAQIAELAKSREADTVILGLPRNMDGSEGFRADKTRRFAALLPFEVIFRDERLTSVSAHAILRDNGKKTVKHKESVDAVAAALILESFLGS